MKAPKVRGWALALASGLALVLAARPAPAQTLERRVEPFATGAAFTLYPDPVTADGAKDAVDLIQWDVPGVQVVRYDDGRLNIFLGRDPLRCLAPKDRSGQPRLQESIPNPLLVVDGVPVGAGNFNWELLSLSPWSVERIDVVKDLASTAVYGGRAACGVIFVYTRRR